MKQVAIHNTLKRVDIATVNWGHNILQQVINKLYNYLKEQEMNSNSQETLLRIEQNDDQFTTLGLSGALLGGRFTSSDACGYSRLGAAIGNNTHLTKLWMNLGADQALNTSNNEFFDGLKRNSSINNLTLICGNQALVGGVGHEILKSYQKINNNLTRLCINGAVLDNGGCNVIAETLRWCTNINTISFGFSSITDEQLLPIVDAIRGHSMLEKLILCRNRIGNAGCEALATLLEDPNSNLQTLDLDNNRIGNEGATAIANSLANNTTLKKLELNENPFDQSAVGILCTVLCNTSSVNDTYLSNHTLDTLVLSDEQQGQHADHLATLLNRNKGTNKSHVAIKKILKFHPNIVMEPLFEWDAEGEQTLKALPYIVNWFERARVAVADEDEEEYNVEERKLSAIFQFAKAMPLLLEGISHINAVNEKRKRED